jgi:hypothetical protein
VKRNTGYTAKVVNVVAGVNAISCPRKGCNGTAFITVPLRQLAELQAHSATSKKVTVKCQNDHVSDVYIRSNILSECLKKEE